MGGGGLGGGGDGGGGDGGGGEGGGGEGGGGDGGGGNGGGGDGGGGDGGGGEGGGGDGGGGDGGCDELGFVQPDTSISSRRKKSPFMRLPSKRIALVSTGVGRMNAVSWPFCVSPMAVCDQLVCASTVVHADVVRLCTRSSKPAREYGGWTWYTTIFSTSLASGHESVTLPLGST